MGQAKRLYVAVSNDAHLTAEADGILAGADVVRLDGLTVDVLDGTYDELVLLVSAPDVGKISEVAQQAVPALKPGGKCHVQQAAAEGAGAAKDAKVDEQLMMQLMLAGLMNPAAAPPLSSSFVGIVASKPSFAVGAKASISLKPKAVPAAPPAATWNMALEDDADDLVDEDDLLTEEDKVKPAPVSNCGVTSTRKACKDCSCGRAEAEAAGIKPKLTQEMIENPQSNCGSCGMGDAFRCAGCPYRGLPKWRPGEKIQLPADFLLADV